MKSLSCVRPSATPWTAAYQAPPSMGFSRQEYWSGVPLPSLSTVNLLFSPPPHPYHHTASILCFFFYIFFSHDLWHVAFIGGSDGKESACNAEDPGSNSGLVIPPGEGNGYTPVFLPGEFHGQRSLVGYSPRGHKELNITEQLTLSLFHGVCTYGQFTSSSHNPCHAVMQARFL